ncbi:MAG: hypothetical protein IKK47_00650 [Ruminococcus sp.]|nr:hypothetical protein [Ruminococcus sp.]
MFRFAVKRNIRCNSALDQKSGTMINGQACGCVADFRYGLCRMSFNGCEVIAVHNALVWLGIPQKLADIAAYMERFRMLMGFFGCSPFKIGKALSHFGADYTKTKNPTQSSAYVVSFWTKRRFLSSIHTVFCVKTDAGTEVYNSSNRCTDVRIYEDIQQYIGKKKPIAVYALKNRNKDNTA